MKQTFTLCLILAAITFTGCKKDAQSAQAKLQGTWTLKSVVGGYPGGTATSTNQIIIFDKNTYKRMVDGIVGESGTFTVEDYNKKLNDEPVAYRLLLATANGTHYYEMNVSLKTLKLYQGEIAGDGTVSLYLKN